MAMLMRVARVCSKLNEDDLGCYASLAYLAERCDASPSQIRAAHNYLVAHGHSLRLSRLSADDRTIGGAKRPSVTARSTIRPVYALTCEMAETLTEEQVLDLIALGEKAPKAELRSEGRDEHESQGQTEARPTAGGGQEPEPAQPLVHDLAPEHRCLVEPLAALALFTGVSLPPGAIEWVADEADRAGIVDYDNVDLAHAADALNELHGALMEERRGAEAMGERPPKFRGGRAGLRSLIIDYLKGKALWLEKHGDVFKARDAARAREQAHEALLSPEQRERRGLAPLLQGVGRETASAGGERPNELAAPAPQKAASGRYARADAARTRGEQAQRPHRGLGRPHLRRRRRRDASRAGSGAHGGGGEARRAAQARASGVRAERGALAAWTPSPFLEPLLRPRGRASRFLSSGTRSETPHAGLVLGEARREVSARRYGRHLHWLTRRRPFVMRGRERGTWRSRARESRLSA